MTHGLASPGMWICRAIAWLMYDPEGTSSDRSSFTITDLLHSADHLMKAIPERDELERGLNRLLQAGVIETKPDGFTSLAPESFWEQLRSNSMSNSQLKRRVPAATRPYAWRLTEDEYNGEVQKYKAWFAEELARLRRADQHPRT